MNISFANICMLIIIFFMFSVFGWIMEVTLKYIQYGRFINRGFLIGPYCPIYGFGALVITVLVGGIIGREGTYGEIFLAGVVICGALEYFASWYMEYAFHARWWDYSNKPMNLNGRIWIGNLVLFGLGSIIIVQWVDPLIFKLLGTWPVITVEIIGVSIMTVFIADYVASHVLMNVVKKEIDKRDEDNTEEISLKIHQLLKNKTVLIRRIHEAYPNLQARPAWLTKQLKKSQEEFNRIKKITQDEIKKALKSSSEDREKRVEAAKAKQKEARMKLEKIKKRFIYRKDQ